MKIRKKAVLAVLAAALAGWGLVRAFSPSAESEVRAVFKKAAGVLEKAGPEEGVLRTAAKERELADLLAREVAFQFEEAGRKGTVSGAEAARRFFVLRTGLAELSVRFSDLEVSFAPDGSAAVRGGAEARIRPRHGAARTETRLVEAVLSDDGGGWRFRSVSVLPVLRR